LFAFWHSNIFHGATSRELDTAIILSSLPFFKLVSLTICSMERKEKGFFFQFAWRVSVCLPFNEIGVPGLCNSPAMKRKEAIRSFMLFCVTSICLFKLVLVWLCRDNADD
jgi:hypothetical protein